MIKHSIEKAADTGSWRSKTPIVDREKCIGCGSCVKFCPEACIILKEQTKKNKTAVIDYKFCKGCGVCAEVCPVKAIKMK